MSTHCEICHGQGHREETCGARPRCTQCGSTHVNVEHPLKPGVIMQVVCKCEPVSVWLGDNKYATTLLPPRKVPWADEDTHARARAIVEAVRDHGDGTMVAFGYESLTAAIAQLVKERDDLRAIERGREDAIAARIARWLVGKCNRWTEQAITQGIERGDWRDT